MPAGRPVEWTDDLKVEAGEKLLAWFASDPSKLFFKSFAHEAYEMSWQGLYAVCKENDKFLVAYNRAKEIQEERLAFGGLTEKYNASMTGLTLKNVSNWRDKQEIGGNDGKPIAMSLTIDWAAPTEARPE